MFDRLTAVEERYEELSHLLASPDVTSNMVLLQQYAREQRDLEQIVTTYRAYRTTVTQLEEAQVMLNETSDQEMRAMVQEEAELLRRRRQEQEEEIKLLLLPRDPNDERDVICEIRQGEGGDEAALFAADLYRMYMRYAETHGWNVELINAAPNEIGGYKEITFAIKAKAGAEKVYSRMKYEGGVHRVQRVPATEARGRIHTSTTTVAILPEVEATDIVIRDEDLRTDVFRAQGHGGQGVNTTDSAVRVVYKGGTPDEMVVTCQDTRSQLKNRERAIGVLRARLYARDQQKRQRELGESRLAQVGTGERAEKIRTYNYPQDRITDHRIGRNFSNLPGVLDGNLDALIDALVVYDNSERLEASGISRA